MIDLGNGFSMRFTSWTPDRTIPSNAERYATISDQEKAGIILTCPHSEGGVLFSRPGFETIFADRPKWTVEQEEPLTISPSIDCGDCGCHGYIKEGRWVTA